MTSTLFVYGTLLHSIESQIARYLRANSRFLGEAYLPGRLYDLGRYPGVVYLADAKSLVYGHLYELKKPEIAWPILDAYEGIDPNKLEQSEYQRQYCTIKKDGKKTEAWVYIYQQKTVQLKEIESGNYLQYLAETNNEDHQSFIQSV